PGAARPRGPRGRAGGVRRGGGPGGGSTMSVREPAELLAELGADLRRGWARPRARRAGPGARRRRPAMIAALAALVLVPTAVATRDVLWAPKPPGLPEHLRAPGAEQPARV